ncbi:unnamed protein product [Auanema sp. JU1783]|nr:unnamed protein product [Auanema sp. JU1783]
MAGPLKLLLLLNLLLFTSAFFNKKALNYYEELESTNNVPFVDAREFSTCESGWTGPYCHNPICSARSPQPSSGSSIQLIEHIYMPNGCSGAYYVPFDSSSDFVFIQVHTGGPNCTIHVTDQSGNEMKGQFGSAPGTCYAQYNSYNPGAYQMTIDTAGLPTVDCNAQIEASSSLAVDQGFSFSPQSDISTYNESPVDGSPMYFVAHTESVLVPGFAQTVTIHDDRNFNVVYRSDLTGRFQCSYELYAGEFVCSQQKMYIWSVDGIDSKGAPFRRSGHFPCIDVPPTTQKPTEIPIIEECFNDGQILRKGTPNASCFCTELYTGSQCEKANCMNGGYADPSGLSCTCDQGYWGDNCEHMTCDPNLAPFLLDRRSLIVVIRNTVSMNQYYPAVLNAINSAYFDGSISGDVVYSNYVLVTYSNGKYRVSDTSQFDNFINSIKNLKTNADSFSNCSDATFQAVFSVFEQEVYDHSPILLITDALASDSQDWKLVSEANSRRKLPIFTFVVQQNGCQKDEVDLGYVSLKRAAEYSGGLFFYPPDVNSLQNTLKNAIIAYTHQMNQILVDDMLKCTTSGYRTFLVDGSAESVQIITTGYNVILHVWDPSWSEDNLRLIYSDGYDSFYEITNVLPGEYLMTVLGVNNNNAACSVRVVSRSSYDLFLATTTDEFIDAIDSEPVLGNKMHFVAQLSGLNITDPFRLFAELTITTNLNNDNNKYQKPMFYSNGKWRDGCGFQIYFGVADFCEFADQPFYATVYIDDVNGFAVQRSTVGFCSLTPTTVTPPGDCQNGGVFVNETCVCRVGFVGDYCQNIICQNGGTPAGGACICAVGSDGTFCEMNSCSTVNLEPSRSTEGKSMVFVVSTRTTMETVWKQLAASVAEFVRDSQYISNTWITNWVIITVNEQEAQFLSTSERPQDFISAIAGVANNYSAYTINETSCLVQLEEAMFFGVLASTPGSDVYVFTDSDGVEDDSLFYQTYSNAINYRVSLNVIASGNICSKNTNNGDLSQNFKDLVYGTNGFVYYTSQIQQFLPYLNTQYRTQTVGKLGGSDCTAGFVGYFAVDSMTNSLSVSVTGGDIIDYTVETPTGRQIQLEVPLVSDDFLDITVLLPSCPANPYQWQSNAQSCYLFSIEDKSWNDASIFCHSFQGSLFDVYNQDKENFIESRVGKRETWIGLRRHNTTWVWDVPDGNHYSTIENTYTKWCPGYPTVGDKADCVTLSTDSCWKNTDCSLKKKYMCQTLRYDPDRAGENTLPPGRYKINIKSAVGGCFAQVSAQSQLMLNYGFVQNAQNDYPDTTGNAGSTNNYLIAHVDGLPPFLSNYSSMESRLNYAFIGFEGNLTNGLSLSPRTYCGYEYITSQPFSCPNGNGDFFVKFSGIDQLGYAFERYTDAGCRTNALTCLNNGVLYNGVCICPQSYTGSRCTVPVCQNGGVLSSKNVCVCPKGFGGGFCENALCEPPYPTNFKDTGKTLAILLETSYNMGSTIYQLKKNLKASLDKLKNDPTTSYWFSNYILYPFDSVSNKQDWYPIVSSTNSDDIVNAVNNITLMKCPGNGCSKSCPRPIMGVIQDTISRVEFQNPSSVILVITRSSPEDVEKARALATPLQESRAQVNFLLSAIDSPCGEGWDSPGVKAMYAVDQYADGNIFVMSPVDLAVNFFQKYLPTLFSSEGIEFYTSEQCDSEEIIFQVDSGMSDFTIDYVLPQITPPPVVTITDPSGNVLALAQNIIQSSDVNYLGIFPVDAYDIGTYRLRVTGVQNNTCMINIRARSLYEIFPAYVNADADKFGGATRDDAHYTPVYYQNSTLVVHANGFDYGTILTYAQIVEPGYGLVFTSALKKRDDGCSYEWYSTATYQCTQPSLKTIIYGWDAHGVYFRRIFRTTCVNNVPKLKPPPARCDLSTAVQDTLFIIDSSLSIGYNNFKLLTQFASNVMQPYKLSSTNTQVGSIVVASSAQSGFNFSSLVSHDDLDTNFKGLVYLNTTGMNLTSAIQLATDQFTTPSSGYRAKTAKHLIVYLTATEPTDNDPQQPIYGLSESGSFGFATIAFNMNSNKLLSSIIDDDCLYYSPDRNDLYVYGVNFLQGLSCAQIKTCGM